MDQNRLPLDEAYMQMAEVWAKRSYATRTKVAALLVKDRQIISDGYNGMPKGMPNELVELPGPNGTIITNPLVIHAEANLFDKLSEKGSSHGANGGTIYCTFSPCVECAKRIINNKIARFVFRDEYRDTEPLRILTDAKVIVEQLRRMP